MSQIEVGPSKIHKSIYSAHAAANDGDTILVDTAEYIGQLAPAHITKKNISIIGKIDSNGKNPLLNARDSTNKAYNVLSRGILAVEPPAPQDSLIVIKNIDFTGAAISSSDGKNAAGIRLSGGSLRAENCNFYYNQNGILGTSTPVKTIELIGCEFAYNGAGDGLSHNVYINGISALIEKCISRNSNTGQGLKIRSDQVSIKYNIIGEATPSGNGNTNVEIDIPNGGVLEILGNVILQNPSTDNSHIISVGQEGALNPLCESRIIHNTIVGYRQTNIFIRHINGTKVPYPGIIKVKNNVFAGEAGVSLYEGSAPLQENEIGNWISDPLNIFRSANDFRPPLSGNWIGLGVVDADTSLITEQLIFPHQVESRTSQECPGCFALTSNCPSIVHTNKYQNPGTPSGYVKITGPVVVPPTPETGGSEVVGLIIKLPDGTYTAISNPTAAPSGNVKLIG